MIGKPEDRLIGTDIVTRLRDWVTIYPEDTNTPEGGLYLEAAAEIERLRAALEWAAVQLGNNNLPAFAHQARAALGGDE